MSKGDILYLKEEEFVATIVTDEEERNIYSLRSELNKIANDYFVSIIEYRKLVRKKLSLKNKIPLYFSDKLFLFTFKSGKVSYWVNFFNILKICYDKNIIVIFKNGTILEIDVNKKIIMKEMEKINIVLEYINNL
jgi:hypothetical protein